jgi:hypothetical protein
MTALIDDSPNRSRKHNTIGGRKMEEVKLAVPKSQLEKWFAILESVIHPHVCYREDVDAMKDEAIEIMKNNSEQVWVDIQEILNSK